MKEEEMTIEQLLALPRRERGKISVYDRLLVVPTGQQYEDTEYEIMAIVGCDKDKPKEVAAYCDNIQWMKLASNEIYFYYNLRCDMLHKSKCLRFWSRAYDFGVGYDNHCLELKMVKKEIYG